MSGPDLLLDTSNSRDVVLQVRARGRQILRNPIANRGTAFTLSERERLDLSGLLPSRVTTMEEQLRRTYAQYSRSPSPLAKFIYLSQLRDRNEVLFYRLLSENIEEMLPIVYTPTIGEAIERFSHEYVGSRGLYLSIDRPDLIEQSLQNYVPDPEDIDLVVVTDSEGILGIGDQGVGGLGIPIGKLSLYTLIGGIRPERTLPIVLDVGTNNADRLKDPLYLGWRNERISGDEYFEFVDRFVRAVKAAMPRTCIQWEDFPNSVAYTLLNKYRDDVLSFNDDIQGTASVALGAILGAIAVTGRPLRDQTIVMLGAGSAGIGMRADRDVATGEFPPVWTVGDPQDAASEGAASLVGGPPRSTVSAGRTTACARGDLLRTASCPTASMPSSPAPRNPWPPSSPQGGSRRPRPT